MQKLRELRNRTVSLLMAGLMAATSVMPAYAADQAVIQDPLEGLTVLEDGEKFNADVKKLAGDFLASKNTKDTTIEAIVWADEIPDEVDTVVKVSAKKHGEVYAWYVSGDDLEAKAEEDEVRVTAPTAGKYVKPTAGGQTDTYTVPSDPGEPYYAEDGTADITDPEEEEDKYKNTVFLYSEDDKVCLPKDASAMLMNLEKLRDISFLEDADFSHAEDLSSMFEGDKALRDITPLRDAETTAVKKIDKIFRDCTAVKTFMALEPHDVFGEPDEYGYVDVLYKAWELGEDVSNAKAFDGTKAKEEYYPEWCTKLIEKEREEKAKKEAEQEPDDRTGTEDASVDETADGSSEETVESVTESAEESVPETPETETASEEETAVSTESVPENDGQEETAESRPEDVQESDPEKTESGQETAGTDNTDSSVEAAESTPEPAVPENAAPEKDDSSDKEEAVKEYTVDKEVSEAKSDEPVEITKADNKEKILDAVIEKYITENADRDKTGKGDLALVNMMTVQQTLFSSSVMTPDETIDSIMTENFDAAMTGWLGSYRTVVPVYSAGDGDYYVAYANTMFNDPDAYVQDADFAHDNVYGEAVDTVIYDRTTGLAYIPKAEYKTEDSNGKDTVMWIQAQFLQRILEEADAVEEVESPVQVSTNTKNGVTTDIQSNQASSYMTTVQTEAGMNPDKLSVTANGVPLTEDDYVYDEETGEITVDVASAALVSLSVTEEKSGVRDTLVSGFASLLGTGTAYAENVHNLIVSSVVGQVEIPTVKDDGSMLELEVGDYWRGYSWYKYAYNGGEAKTDNTYNSTYMYGYGPATNEQLQKMADTIYYFNQDFGDQLFVKGRGLLNQQIDFTKNGSTAQGAPYGVGTYNMYSRTGALKKSANLPFTTFGAIGLFCGHINNPLATPVYNATPRSDYAFIGEILKETIFRVLSIDTLPDGRKTMTFGVLAASNADPSELGQSGLGIFRVYLKPTVRSFKLNKTDGSFGTSVPGSMGGVFEIYALDNSKSGTVTLNGGATASGQWVKLGNMTDANNTGVYTYDTTVRNTNPNDWYRIVEKTAPNGYTVNGNQGKEIIFQNTSTVRYTVTMENTPNPVDIDLRKIDAYTSARLTGAEFTVYEWDGTAEDYVPLGTMTEDASDRGHYVYTDLQATSANRGRFRVKETGTPVSLEADTAYPDLGQRTYTGEYQYDFVLSLSDAVNGSLTLPDAKNTPNQEKGKIIIKKTDASTGEVLGDGTVFKIYSAQNGSNTDFMSAPCGVMTYNAATHTYESQLLPRVERVFDADPERNIGFNNGYYKIVEEQPIDGYFNDTSTSPIIIQVLHTGDYATVQMFDGADHNGVAVPNTPNGYTISKKNGDGAVGIKAAFKLISIDGSEHTATAGDTAMTVTTEWDTAAALETAADGTLRITKLAPGEYAYREESVMDGLYNYAVDDTVHYFTVDSNGKVSDEDSSGATVSREIRNFPEEKIVITKLDTDYDLSTQQYLSGPNGKDPTEDPAFPYGTVFAIYEWNDNLTADGAGRKYESAPYAKSVWDLNLGKFCLSNAYGYSTGKDVVLEYSPTNKGKFLIREIKQAPGYILDHEEKEITISPTAKKNTDAPYTVSFENTPNGITITKKDSKGGVLPEGYSAEFVFRSPSRTSVTVSTAYDSATQTNSADLYRLEPGTWTYNETAVKKNGALTTEYSIDPNSYTFVVNEDGTIDVSSLAHKDIEVSDSRQRTVRIIKRDSLTGEEMEVTSGFPQGTTFGIFEYDSETGSYKTTPTTTVIPEFAVSAEEYAPVNAESAENDDINGMIYPNAVALIDTGVNRTCTNVLARISVIGDDPSDDNGHGTAMAEAIVREYPDADILSIKAFDSNGQADASAVADAINIAMEHGVRVINLSCVAPLTENSKAVADRLQAACDAGIIVVGSAGNGTEDVTQTVPGCVDDAVIAGRTGQDNGSDTYIDIANTSTAAAIVSAQYAAGTRVSADDRSGVSAPHVPVIANATDEPFKIQASESDGNNPAHAKWWFFDRMSFKFYAYIDGEYYPRNVRMWFRTANGTVSEEVSGLFSASTGYIYGHEYNYVASIPMPANVASDGIINGEYAVNMWYTPANESSSSWAPEAPYTPSGLGGKNWYKVTHFFTYDPNGGTVTYNGNTYTAPFTGAISNGLYKQNNEMIASWGTVAGQEATTGFALRFPYAEREGYVFCGWANLQYGQYWFMVDKEYAADPGTWNAHIDEITSTRFATRYRKRELALSSSETLTARWMPIEYTIDEGVYEIQNLAATLSSVPYVLDSESQQTDTGNAIVGSPQGTEAGTFWKIEHSTNTPNTYRILNLQSGKYLTMPSGGTDVPTLAEEAGDNTQDWAIVKNGNNDGYLLYSISQKKWIALYDEAASGDSVKVATTEYDSLLSYWQFNPLHIVKLNYHANGAVLTGGAAPDDPMHYYPGNPSEYDYAGLCRTWDDSYLYDRIFSLTDDFHAAHPSKEWTGFWKVGSPYSLDRIAAGVSIEDGNLLTTLQNYGYTAADQSNGITEVDLYADFDMRYNITYNLNGGSMTGNPAYYITSESAIPLNPPQKLGYVFNGWTLRKENGTTIQVTEIPAGLTGDITLTANWVQGTGRWTDETTHNLPILTETARNEGKFMIKELTSTPGYLRNDTVFTFDLNDPSTYRVDGDGNILFEFTNTPNELTLRKLVAGDEATPIAGVRFKVWYENDTAHAAEYTTGTDGRLTTTLRRLKDGTWHYQEVADSVDPSRYYADTSVKTFTVKDGVISLTADGNNTVRVLNASTEHPYYTVQKVDQYGNRIPGVVFTVRINNGAAVQYTTGSDGTFTFPLETAGNYRVAEASSQPNLAGYAVDTTPHSFTVQAVDGKLVTTDNSYVFEHTNTKNKYTIKKTDANGAALAGAVFSVWKGSDTAHATEYTTDADGVIELEALSNGTWHYKEVAAPDGYVVGDSSTKSFTVSDGKISGSSSGSATVSNRKNTFNLRKTGANGAALAGVQFQIYSKDNPAAYNTTVTTGADGQIPTISGLAPGTYAYREVSTAMGYILDASEKTFTVTAQTDDISLTAENVPNRFELNKTNEGGVPLPNVVFDFTFRADSQDNAAVFNYFRSKTGYRKNGATVTFTDRTGSDGKIRYDMLPDGTYTFKEKSNPNTDANGTQYSLDTAEHTFTVRDGALSSSDFAVTELSPDALAMQIVNTAQPKGIIYLTKVDQSDPTKTLEGAAFKVYQVVNGTETLLYDSDNAHISYNERRELYQIAALPITPENGGHFVIEEVRSPAGYIMNGLRKEVTVSKNGNGSAQFVEYVTLTNKTNRMRIFKTNEEGDPLQGAVFTLRKTSAAGYDGETTEYTLTTGPDGYTPWVTRLSEGTWTYTETTAPLVDPESGNGKRYTADTTVKQFTVSADGLISENGTGGTESFSVTAVNKYVEKTPLKIVINKTDDNAEPMEGVRFDLYKADNEGHYGTIPTMGMTWDSTKHMYVSGSILADNEDMYGKWKVMETSAPDGYVTADPVEIDLDLAAASADTDGHIDLTDGTYTLDITNRKNMVRIRKTDKSGNGLAGAVFTLMPDPVTVDGATYTEDPIVTGETDNEGWTVLRGIPDGAYTVTETKAPDAYFNASESFRVVVANGKIVSGTGTGISLAALNGATGASASAPYAGMEFIFTNEPTGVTILKTDMNGTPLQGAKFKIERISNSNHPSATYQDLRSEYAGTLVQYDNNLENILPFIKVVEEDLGTLTTGTDGKIVLNNLKHGLYVMKETTAPATYRRLENEITFLVTAEGVYIGDADRPVAIGETPVLTVLNGEKDITIELEKTNEDRTRKLEGAEFTVYPYSQTAADYDMQHPVMVIGADNWDNTSKTYKATLQGNGDNALRFLIKETKAPDGYQIDEGWSAEIDGSVRTEWAFTGVHAVRNGQSGNRLTVQKVWQDGNNAAGTRPSSITVDLMNGSSVVRTITIQDDGTGRWEGEFNDIEPFDAGGNTIVYTVREHPVAGYTPTVAIGEAADEPVYVYPANISTETPQTAATVAPVPVAAGGTTWNVVPGINTSAIPSGNVTFRTFDWSTAVLTEYAADGSPVPEEDRVFAKTVSDGSDCITFTDSAAPYATDHTFDLLFRGAALVQDGTADGSVRDVLVTVSGIGITGARSAAHHIILRAGDTGFCVGALKQQYTYGVLDADVNVRIPGVTAGTALMTYRDVDQASASEAIALRAGDFEDTVYTAALSSENPVRTARAEFSGLPDGSLKLTGITADSDTFRSGMAAVANIDADGATVHFTGQGCGIVLCGQNTAPMYKAAVDGKTVGSEGGTITGIGDWTRRNYGEAKVLTLTPKTGWHVSTLTIDGNAADLSAFGANGKMTVTTGADSAGETVTLYQRANGIIDVVLPAQTLAKNNAPNTFIDHLVNASFGVNETPKSYIITNTADTSAEGTKTWKAGEIPHVSNEKLALVLYRRTAGQPASADTAVAYDAATQLSWNGDTYTISGIPKYSETGAEYVYTVKETAPAGFTATQTGNDITNTFIQEKVSVTGTKTWKDGGKAHTNNTDIVLTLKRTANGRTETVDATPSWNGNTYRYDDLDKYNADGYAYTYTVTEAISRTLAASLPSGDTYTSAADSTGRNFTNTLTGKTQITGTKTWKDGGKTHTNSADIVLTLKRKSAKQGSAEETVNATPAWNGNTYRYDNLDKYDADGYAYTYTVTEALSGTLTASLPDGDTYTSVADSTGRNFTNTLTGKTQVTGTKTWKDGGRTHTNSADIVLTLKRKSAKQGSAEETVNATPAWNGNTYRYDDLDKYDADGYAYTYTVTETVSRTLAASLPNGDTYTSAADSTGRNFTNTLTGKTEITGTKTWDDGDLTISHTNSTEVVLTLKRKSAKTGSAEETVNATPTWNGARYRFRNLDKYDAEGYLYTYTVTEAPVASYETTYSGYDITNKHVIDGVIEIGKVTTVNGVERPLAGAHFKLTDAAGNAVRNKLGQTVEPWVSTEELHRIESLADGTYYLHETQAPKGFMLLAEPVRITVSGGKADPEVLKVENMKKETLRTGGSGRTLIYIGGGVLLVILLALAVYRTGRKKK